MKQTGAAAAETVMVYEPNCRKNIGFFKTWALMFRNIRESRELILQLFKRDFFAVYKKSFFGIGWILVAPIVGVVSWVFMNAIGMLRPGDVGIPYPAYVLFSSSIWGLFMGFYTSAAGTLDAGAGFIMQVKYPHEALVVKQTAQHLANFAIGFAMNVAVLVLCGVLPSWKIVFFPLLTIPLFFLGAGIGLMVSVFSVIGADARRTVDLILGLMIFVTPVIYASDYAHPVLQRIVAINPLSYLIGDARDLMIYGIFPHPFRYAISAAASLAVFFVSWRLFFVSEDKVIEKMI